jgi:murein DD-endopeptidase MepM/ murein hydrolase activator NlpD
MKRILILVAVLALLASACSQTPSPPSRQDDLPATVVALHAPRATRASAGSPATPRLPFRTPTPDPTQNRPPQPTEVYLIQRGDTLGAVALEYGTTPEELAAINGLTNLNTIKAGQPIVVPIKVTRSGPANKLVPDSELVYSPAYAGFDVEAFVRTQRGYLKNYAEEVDKQALTGAQIVQFIADRYSVGPRVLLAMLEYQSGWLSDPTPDWQSIMFPLGFGDPNYKGLVKQLARAADQLNDGYYGYKTRGYTTVRFADGSRALIAQGLNAGTIGVQTMLARVNTFEGWQQALGPKGFSSVYAQLFGDPFAKSVEPLVPSPAALTPPALKLPWSQNETWYYTSGPHGGWGDGSAWSAVDFIPPDTRTGCYDSDAWVTAAADGVVVRTATGTVIQAIAGGDSERTGWTILYLHLTALDRVETGARLKAGDRVGHPSCEGGVSDGTHVHIARRYNGEWIAADGPLPMIFAGWQVHLTSVYNGTLTKGDQTRTACACRNDSNAVAGEP